MNVFYLSNKKIFVIMKIFYVDFDLVKIVIFKIFCILFSDMINLFICIMFVFLYVNMFFIFIFLWKIKVKFGIV